MNRGSHVAALSLVVSLLTSAGCKQKSAPPQPAQQAQNNVLEALQSSGRDVQADAVKGACVPDNWCACVGRAVPYALELGQPADALALLEAAGTCKDVAGLDGMRAEAMAREGKGQEAVQAAGAVLKAAPSDMYARYALAHASYLHGDWVSVRQHAQLALEAGRASPARLLLGLAALQNSQLTQAEAEFEATRQLDPKNVVALYNLGLVQQRLDRYGKARESYLGVLRLDPKHFEARHNLVILTRDAGASLEAQHHLSELRRIAPKDPRLVELERSLRPVSPPAASSSAAPNH